MKLYFKAGACSRNPHILLRESGLPFTIEAVDLATKKTASGADYLAINPKGQVPALALDDGTVLTENAAIAQYIADRAGEGKLMPPPGTMERYRALEWLSYVGTEIHKSMSPFFNPKTPEEYREIARAALRARFAFLSRALDGHAYLMGDTFSVADAYLFVVLSWTPKLGLDLAEFPALEAFVKRVAARPATVAAIAAETAA